ncbi:hypothetical protein MATL_G00221470 [Megalops atlanticus]|uniref:Ig-like domain-containing protein n=1 Tax=Megalops atlanticus TaxID=7932 RepID=A0A9D3SYJ8_MEGAT|nr:hypothetical protein MATL_G00221470 [Megalops atlanticus]
MKVLNLWRIWMLFVWFVWALSIFSPDCRRDTAAIVVKGISDTELKDQFKGRLQWNSETGLFTITHLRAEDSGEYKVDSKDEQKKLTTFQLEVYERVSTPTVTVTSVRRLNCSVLCSVENGREVTLSWQREGETLSNTRSPDLNTPLSPSGDRRSQTYILL